MTESEQLAADQGAAYRFVEGMVPRADVRQPFPAWHGWALRDAYLAGLAAGRAEAIRGAIDEAGGRMDLPQSVVCDAAVHVIPDDAFARAVGKAIKAAAYVTPKRGVIVETSEFVREERLRGAVALTADNYLAVIPEDAELVDSTTKGHFGMAFKLAHPTFPIVRQGEEYPVWRLVNVLRVDVRSESDPNGPCRPLPPIDKVFVVLTNDRFRGFVGVASSLAVANGLAANYNGCEGAIVEEREVEHGE